MTSAKARAIAILFLLVIATPYSQAVTQMPNLEIFNRCYNRLVKKPMPVSGTSKGFELYTAVRTGQKTGPQACYELVTYASLGADGVMTNQTSDEARRVMDTLHTLHVSFFDAPHFGTYTEYRNMTALIKDIDEPALYFTQALFGSKDPATILTSNQTLRSVRESNLTPGTNYTTKSITSFHESSFPAGEDPRRVLVYESNSTNQTALQTSDTAYLRDVAFASQIAAANAAGDTAQLSKINTTIANTVSGTRVMKTQILPDTAFIGQGPILGVVAQSPLIMPMFIIRYSVNANGANAVMTTDWLNHNVNWHNGGGVLGTQMYLLKNSNLGMNTLIGGTATVDAEYTSVPRRMTSRIYEDLLCHTLPTLTEDDVKADISSTSKFGFRQTASCMRCHASFDPMAGVFRNLIVDHSSQFNNDTSQFKMARARGSPIVSVVKLQSTTQNIYALKPTTGTLRYRDHKGTYENKTVNSVAELGLEMSKSGDFYRCMAKRYYHFLTGVDVNLYSKDADLSTEGKKHKDFVFLLGRTLQGSFADSAEQTKYSSQQKSMFGMIQMIFNSDAFKSRASGTVEE